MLSGTLQLRQPNSSPPLKLSALSLKALPQKILGLLADKAPEPFLETFNHPMNYEPLQPQALNPQQPKQNGLGFWG